MINRNPRMSHVSFSSDKIILGWGRRGWGRRGFGRMGFRRRSPGGFICCGVMIVIFAIIYAAVFPLILLDAGYPQDVVHNLVVRGWIIFIIVIVAVVVVVVVILWMKKRKESGSGTRSRGTQPPKPAATAPPATLEPVQKPAKEEPRKTGVYCINCGKIIVAHARYCEFCGEKQ